MKRSVLVLAISLILTGVAYGITLSADEAKAVGIAYSEFEQSFYARYRALYRISVERDRQGFLVTFAPPVPKATMRPSKPGFSEITIRRSPALPLYYLVSSRNWKVIRRSGERF